MSVAVVTHVNVGHGPQIAGGLRRAGYEVVGIESSALGRRQVASTIAEATEKGSAVLVNNLPDLGNGPVLGRNGVDFATAIDLGLNSLFSACREAARNSQRTGTPLVIVNIVSATGMVGLGGRVEDACVSAGVLAATKALAAEWGETDIRVVAVVVGPSNAGRWGEHPETTPGVIPLGRVVTGEDVAGAVDFLVSGAARSVTGGAVTVDAGWLAHGWRRESS
jgi:NAD(P)-dependent dehydrogenase (short-subunit alcohol dehydrogenase family)